MSHPQVRLSPNVIQYLRHEIDRRTEYRTDLEQTPVYLGSDSFYRTRNQEARQTLEAAIKKLTGDIFAVAKEYIPTLQLNPSNDELTIMAILSALPPLEKITPVRQVSARGAE